MGEKPQPGQHQIQGLSHFSESLSLHPNSTFILSMAMALKQPNDLSLRVYFCALNSEISLTVRDSSSIRQVGKT
jgi:hypothetical protein